MKLCVKWVIKISSVTASGNLILCGHIVYPYRSLTHDGHTDAGSQPPCSRPEVCSVCLEPFQISLRFWRWKSVSSNVLILLPYPSFPENYVSKPQQSRSKTAFLSGGAACMSLAAVITEPYLHAATCHTHQVGWEALKTAVFWP